MPADENEFLLIFQPALCLGEKCRICPLACPEKALSLNPTTSLPHLTLKKPRLLASGNLLPCRSCGGPTAVTSEQAPVCFVCRNKKNQTGFFKSLIS